MGGSLRLAWCAAGRQFDLVVLQDMLDHRTGASLTERVYELLAPGGQAVFYENNP